MTSAIATMMTVPNDSATGTHERDASPGCLRLRCGGRKSPTACTGAAGAGAGGAAAGAAVAASGAGAPSGIAWLTRVTFRGAMSPLESDTGSTPSTTSTVVPTLISAPPPSSVGSAMRVPSTNVPLVEPRSSTWSRLAWRRTTA